MDRILSNLRDAIAQTSIKKALRIQKENTDALERQQQRRKERKRNSTTRISLN